MSRRDDLENRTLEIIARKRDEGVLQSELWRELGASSREGSRIAIKLAKKNLIRRERELWKGRWTYRLFSERRLVSIDSIIDCPCLMCSDDSKCGVFSEVSPNKCVRLTEWLLTLVEKENLTKTN